MSFLHIAAGYNGSRTIITDCAFSSPLKIARPIYCNDLTEVIQMSASAGLLDGDEQDISINVSDRAFLRYTGQSFTKIFKADEKGAVQNVRISVSTGGCLLYLPRPVIPFSGSRFRGTTEIHLEKESRFFGWDFLSCGRVGMGESFAWDSYWSKMTVYLEGQPVFLDTQRYIPQIHSPAGIGFFEGYSHIGTAYIYGAEDISIPDNKNIARTKALAGICIRAAGHSAEEILGYFQKIRIDGDTSSWLVF